MSEPDWDDVLEATEVVRDALAWELRTGRDRMLVERRAGPTATSTAPAATLAPAAAPTPPRGTKATPTKAPPAATTAPPTRGAPAPSEKPPSEKPANQGWARYADRGDADAKLRVQQCVACPRSKGRSRVWVAQGASKPRLAVVGHEPGQEEESAGRLWVGPAEETLQRMLENVLGLKPGEVLFLPPVLCRPKDGHAPTDAEVSTCAEPFFSLLPEGARVLALGPLAVSRFWGAGTKLADVRGQVASLHGRRVLATYHPAEMLADRTLRQAVFDDLRALAAELVLP